MKIMVSASPIIEIIAGGNTTIFNVHFKFCMKKAADRSAAFWGYAVMAAAFRGFMGAKVEMACL